MPFIYIQKFSRQIIIDKIRLIVKASISRKKMTKILDDKLDHRIILLSFGLSMK